MTVFFKFCIAYKHQTYLITYTALHCAVLLRARPYAPSARRSSVVKIAPALLGIRDVTLHPAWLAAMAWRRLWCLNVISRCLRHLYSCAYGARPKFSRYGPRPSVPAAPRSSFIEIAPAVFPETGGQTDRQEGNFIYIYRSWLHLKFWTFTLGLACIAFCTKCVNCGKILCETCGP